MNDQRQKSIKFSPDIIHRLTALQWAPVRAPMDLKAKAMTVDTKALRVWGNAAIMFEAAASIMFEAADELEKLRAQLADVTRERDEARIHALNVDATRMKWEHAEQKLATAVKALEWVEENAEGSSSEKARRALAEIRGECTCDWRDSHEGHLMAHPGCPQHGEKKSDV